MGVCWCTSRDMAAGGHEAKFIQTDRSTLRGKVSVLFMWGQASTKGCRRLGRRADRSDKH